LTGGRLFCGGHLKNTRPNGDEWNVSVDYELVLTRQLNTQNSVMPDLIRHPVITLDAGLRRNDECGVFNCRSNNTGCNR